MARLRYNNQGGNLGTNLTAGGTAIQFAAPPDFATLVTPDYIPIVLDAGTSSMEIVHLTTYSSGSTSGTIVRQAEDASHWPATSHASSGTWVVAPTVLDVDMVVGGTASDPQDEIQFRSDTAAHWTSTNPTLGLGEPGVETDTKEQKIGDGVTAWNSLPYFGGAGATITSPTGDYTVSPPLVGATITVGGTPTNPTLQKPPHGPHYVGDYPVGSINSLNTLLTNLVADAGALGTSVELNQGILGGTTSLIVPPFTKITGQGPNFHGSCFQINSGTASDGVTMLEGNGSTTNAFFCTLRDFMIDLNSANSAGGGWNQGLTCVTNPFNSKASGDPDFDPQHRFERLYIKNATGEAIYYHGRSEALYDGVWCENNQGTGLIIGFDSEVMGSKIQSCGLGGIYMDGGDITINNCHVYNNGFAAQFTNIIPSGSGTAWALGGYGWNSPNGTFTVTVPEGTSAPIAFNASASTIATAIQAIGGFVGTCTGSGGPLNSSTAVGLTFSNTKATLTVTQTQTWAAGQHVMYLGAVYIANSLLTNYTGNNPLADTTNWTAPQRPLAVANGISARGSVNTAPEWGYAYYMNGGSWRNITGGTTSQNAAGGVYMHNCSSDMISLVVETVNANPGNGNAWTANPNNNAAVVVDNSHNCNIKITTLVNGASSYVLRLINGSVNNHIEITTDGTGGPLLSPDTDLSLFTKNTVIVNGAIYGISEHVNTVAVGGAAQTLVGVANDITLSANLTVTMPPLIQGAFTYGIFRQPPSGGTYTYTIALTSVRWPAGTAPTLTTGAAATDRYDFVCDGTAWYGVVSGQAFA